MHYSSSWAVKQIKAQCKLLPKPFGQQGGTDLQFCEPQPTKVERPWTQVPVLPCPNFCRYIGYIACRQMQMCVNNLLKVQLHSAAVVTEPAISNHKSNTLTTTPLSHTVLVNTYCIIMMSLHIKSQTGREGLLQLSSAITVACHATAKYTSTTMIRLLVTYGQYKLGWQG